MKKTCIDETMKNYLQEKRKKQLMLMLGEIYIIKKQEGKSSIKKQNYLKTVSEWNNLRSLNKNVVGRNINILSKQEYDDVIIEYG